MASRFWAPRKQTGDTEVVRAERRRSWIRHVLLVLGPALVAVVAGYFYVTGGRYVSTDDAYLKADKVAISPQVSGPIVKVEVRENQHVEQGQPLFQIDDAPFKIALAQAEARLNKAATQIRSLKATYAQKQEQLELARSNVAFTERVFHRYENAGQKVVSPAEYDDAEHKLLIAQRQVSVIEQDLAGVLADLNDDPDIPLDRHPSYLEAKAARDLAALDLEHIVVAAPFAGVASQKPELGDYVTAGTPVMSVVADQDVWVEANFKETDLTHVQPGQAATVEVDTYPDLEWPAQVESISQATGAEFSVLPAQNSTGNWVKVVQRIPVRIAIRPEKGGPALRAGMSINVEIDTGHRRELPGFVETALAWAGWLAEPNRAEARNRQ